ncbi:MAG: hypothetical protein QM749_14140 [Aquabacterium sp.]
MAAHDQAVWDFVRTIHRRHDIHQVYTQCLLFMIDCLHEVRKALPERAVHALDLAEHYCHGKVTAAQLDAERKRLWAFLIEADLAYSFESRRARLYRATLCVLYPSPSEDADVYKVLEWFLQMYDPEGRRAAQTLALLTMRFAE